MIIYIPVQSNNPVNYWIISPYIFIFHQDSFNHDFTSVMFVAQKPKSFISFNALKIFTKTSEFIF